MLVLSRQRDETIMIGDDIEITVVDIRGDKVRLGITAPSTIPVHRKEVYEAIQRENREASKVKMEDLGQFPKGSAKGPNRPAVPFARPGQGGKNDNKAGSSGGGSPEAGESSRKPGEPTQGSAGANPGPAQ